jgi:hypothetical protein
VSGVWILTESYNDYDQHGDYFVTAWDEKPSRKEISHVCDIDTTGRYTKADQDIDHILAGGGRIGNEYRWWNLFEIVRG